MASLIDSANCKAAFLFDGEASGDNAIDYTGGGALYDIGSTQVLRASSHAGYGTGVYANFAGGSSDTRLVGGSPRLHTFTEFTVCLWVYVNETAMPSANRIFLCTESSTGARSLRIYFDYVAQRFAVDLSYSGGTVATKAGPSAPTVKIWYWLCAVVKGAALYFYQNNVMSGLQTSLIMPVDFGASWSLGQFSDGGDASIRHKGRIDEVACFDKPLTATERALVYASGLGAEILTLERALHNNATSIVDLLDPSLSTSNLDVRSEVAELVSGACEVRNLLAPVLSIEEPLDTEICMP